MRHGRHNQTFREATGCNEVDKSSAHTVPEWALAFRFDIVLRGREGTPMDEEKH